jgi:hypothetical protein
VVRLNEFFDCLNESEGDETRIGSEEYAIKSPNYLPGNPTYEQATRRLELLADSALEAYFALLRAGRERRLLPSKQER